MNLEYFSASLPKGMSHFLRKMQISSNNISLISKFFLDGDKMYESKKEKTILLEIHYISMEN